MAKTIEERATEMAISLIRLSPMNKPTTRELLIKMATDQRKIDIEKACEWIEENLFSVNEKGEYKYVAHNIFGSPYIKIHLFGDFRKAMEE